MTVEQLLEKAETLAKSIEGASGDARYELHQQLHRTLEMIRVFGGAIPAQLKRLDLDLLDEEIEDSFDNMPI
ncbi:hypothetical protein [Shimia abyssi]|uniref:Uncharacterized protein n=1 Tax=Shimia abyssi TaxID=1662395 RepID=A0A2P8FJ58_9RHOB|nr:hypothetical protein [Shimia abyssi]PSL21733.1 hypothetical protein CLV88_101157 [Shimia abyssi]